MIKFDYYLYVLLVQQIFLIRADETCYYTNQSVLVPINCQGSCCSGMSTSPQTACCYDISWSTIAVPAFVIIGVCLIAICLVYFRPLVKFCLCGYKCPCFNRSRVTSANPTIDNTSAHVMANGDLPDYESVIKESTPPPYNFVTSHPTDFHIDARIPSAPPQYRSRPNSSTAVGSLAPIHS